MADFSYDVADCCDIDPVFGGLRGFDRLRDEAHARDIRLILDWVPNHSSDQHPVVAAHYGHDDQLHLAFNLEPLFAPWEAGAWRGIVDDIESAYGAADAWPTWVLSNHDQVRHRSRYGSEARARAAAVLLLTLRGTPFLYAGEELGLENAEVPPGRIVDPGGRDGCRAPIPWDASGSHGWATADPWLPWPPDAAQRNAAQQRDDPASILQLYRRLLAARRSCDALRTGGFAWLEHPDGVLAYTRASTQSQRAVLVNFSDDQVAVPLDGAWTVEVASDGRGEAAAFDGRLSPSQALVLAPG